MAFKTLLKNMLQDMKTQAKRQARIELDYLANDMDNDHDIDVGLKAFALGEGVFARDDPLHPSNTSLAGNTSEKFRNPAYMPGTSRYSEFD